MKIKNVEAIVHGLLIEHPSARDDDDVLYALVLDACGADLNVSVVDFLYTRGEMDLPPFETVRRTRQKIQADCEDLRGSRRIRLKRKEAEETFRAYAVS